MAPSSSSSSIQFIDTALKCTTPFALSYTDTNQKTLIRKHLLSFLQDYPTFTPSTDRFTHNDGTSVNLLNVSGNLHVSNSKPPINLTIWVHEYYPFMPPTLFITSNPKNNPIHQNHPFVDQSGLITSPYLQTWSDSYSRCNLSDLVRNLVKIFFHDHPFFYHSSSSSFTHPSMVSKREAVDRLSGMIHYDMVSLQHKTDEEIVELSILQEEMQNRVGVATSIVNRLEDERMKLEYRVMELAEEADMLMNWLKFCDLKSSGVIVEDEVIEDVFEGVDDDSGIVIDALATDRGIEDVMYALDKALEQGVVSFDLYMKQVRNLAREQFWHRGLLVKLKGSDILI